MEKQDHEWGCRHINYTEDGTIKACVVTIEDLQCIAEKLTSSVLDTSWMLTMDIGTKRSYQYTARETADALVKIFRNVTDRNSLSAEFGEVMVSIGSTRALELIFEHRALPIAEISKPQKKQNEGFDFHTECKGELINFGEAKYSGSINPHGEAIPQASRFLKEEKHLRDRVHLINLTGSKSIENLDSDNFGVVVAFSINSKDTSSIMRNAIDSVKKSDLMNNSRMVYVVGVKC